MKQPITRIRASNFSSLGDVDIPLSPLTVLKSPNGSGKSNVRNVLRFPAAAARSDLAAIKEWGGFERVQRQSMRPGVAYRQLMQQVVVPGSHGEVPVEKLEAWWFPTAIDAVRPSGVSSSFERFQAKASSVR